MGIVTELAITLGLLVLAGNFVILVYLGVKWFINL